MLSLTQVLDLEAAEITAGRAQPCRADHHGGVDPDELCQRVEGHEETGQAAREAHARIDTGTPEVPGRYWVTWLNVTAQGRPTSQLTKPDAP